MNEWGDARRIVNYVYFQNKISVSGRACAPTPLQSWPGRDDTRADSPMQSFAGTSGLPPVNSDTHENACQRVSALSLSALGSQHATRHSSLSAAQLSINQNCYDRLLSNQLPHLVKNFLLIGCVNSKLRLTPSTSVSAGMCRCTCRQRIVGCRLWLAHLVVGNYREHETCFILFSWFAGTDKEARGDSRVTPWLVEQSWERLCGTLHTSWSPGAPGVRLL